MRSFEAWPAWVSPPPYTLAASSAAPVVTDSPGTAQLRGPRPLAQSCLPDEVPRLLAPLWRWRYPWWPRLSFSEQGASLGTQFSPTPGWPSGPPAHPPTALFCPLFLTPGHPPGSWLLCKSLPWVGTTPLLQLGWGGGEESPLPPGQAQSGQQGRAGPSPYACSLPAQQALQRGPTPPLNLPSTREDPSHGEGDCQPAAATPTH